MADQSFAVLGLGKFGMALTVALLKAEQDVLVIDSNEEVINDVAHLVTHAVIADATDEDELRDLDIGSFDHVFVTMGENVEGSIITTMLAKKLGAPDVTTRANNHNHRLVLEKIGADSVISPEYEMGQSLAQTILFHNNVDVFQLDKNVSIVEMKIPSVWAGQSLSQLDLRGKYNLNVLGFREQENSPLDVQFGPNDLLKADAYILAVINNQYLDDLAELNS